MKPKQNQSYATPDARADSARSPSTRSTSARGRRLSRESGVRTRKSSTTSGGSSAATRGSSRSELKGLQDDLSTYFTPGNIRQSRTSTGKTVQRTPSGSPAAKESGRTSKKTTPKHTAPLPLHNLKVVVKPFAPTKNEPLDNVASNAVPHDPSASQNQPGPSNSATAANGKQPTVAKPLAKLVPQVRTLVPHGPPASQNQPVPSKSAAQSKEKQPTPTTEPSVNDVSIAVPHDPSAIQNQLVPSNSAAQTKGQQSTVAKPVASFSEVVSAQSGNAGSAEPLSALAHRAPKPLANLPFGPAKTAEPLGIFASAVVPLDPAASQDQPVPSNGAAAGKEQLSKINVATVPQHDQNQLDPSSGATVSKELQPMHNATPMQQQDAESQRPGGSGTQAQPPSKKRQHVQVVNVEHISVPSVSVPSVNKVVGSARKRAQPQYDATDQLARDIRNVGSKASKMGESENDWQIRLFHAAREAHNVDADLRIRCEKFVEFIVDESFIGREPRDRRELFESLLDQCIQGFTLEELACDDPPNMRALKVYSKRVRAWKVIRELFPRLLKGFQAQPEVSSPIEVLTADAFTKINKYLGALKETMPSMPQVLKEAVVWQLLGSAGHRYEGCTEGIRDRVAEKICENDAWFSFSLPIVTLCLLRRP